MQSLILYVSPFLLSSASHSHDPFIRLIFLLHFIFLFSFNSLISIIVYFLPIPVFRLSITYLVCYLSNTYLFLYLSLFMSSSIYLTCLILCQWLFIFVYIYISVFISSSVSSCCLSSIAHYFSCQSCLIIASNISHWLSSPLFLLLISFFISHCFIPSQPLLISSSIFLLFLWSYVLIFFCSPLPLQIVLISSSFSSFCRVSPLSSLAPSVYIFFTFISSLFLPPSLL
jgi:hypothetical protein